ncbi:MAG: MdtA/MuxA family multidrug efflux RND transporter periplasmic adaptor subunit [Proteobacteria bacterium]|nr:MdtA/MuxA family multidrug efflux RND transporter periplasmic adaptor subunit [Pseudomonadota bacterium]
MHTPTQDQTISQPPHPTRRKAPWLLLAAACLAIGGGAYWYKAQAKDAKQEPGGKNRPVPVAVIEAKSQDVEVFLSGLGTVSPQSSVTIKSRVDGQLMQVLVREGQVVRAGELLLVIDPRPSQVQLAQAEGQLKRDTALLENARLDLKRFADLLSQGAIARQQLDTQQSLVHQYEGAVASDKAQADSARLQITYSRITAPFSGQVGLRQVDPGNMVRASDQTGLLVVNQLSPINVLFTLPEDQLPRVLAKLRTGEKLRVDVYDREQTHKLGQGELASMDNQIDPSTGTVRLKAAFANAQGELFPNQFVNAKLLVEVQKDAVVVPAATVQRGQQGTYVYVVSPEGVAKARPVSVGETGDHQSVILSGLAVGEKVVVEGADRLRDGAQVEVKEPGGKPGGKEGKPGKPGEPAASQNATRPEPAPAAQEGKHEVKLEAKRGVKPEARPEAKSEGKPEPSEAQAGSQPKAKP